MKWKAGIPNKPGIYWFDTGLNPELSEFLILEMFKKADGKLDGYISGPTGNCAGLDFVYHPKYCKNARYQQVQPIKKLGPWKDIQDYKKERYSWVREKTGYYALGILQSGTHGPHGTMIYLNNPNCGAAYNYHMDYSDGAFYQPIIKPDK